MALTCGFTFLICLRCASMISREESFFLRRASRRSTARMKGMLVDGGSMVEIEAVTPSLRVSRRVISQE